MNFFRQNKYSVGIIAELLSVLLTAAVLLLVLTILSISPMEHIRWFGGAFIPGILVLRAYARKKECPKATKAAVVTFFLAFILFIVYLGMTRQLF